MVNSVALRAQRTPRRKNNYTTSKGSPPGLSDPDGWFDFADADGRKSMSQEELISAMCRTVRASSSQRVFLRNAIQDSWSKFDKNHDMQISKHEFMNKRNGMIPFLIKLEKECAKIPNNHSSSSSSSRRSSSTRPPRRKPAENPPPLSRGKEWYGHYDTSRDNSLSKEEIVHGIFEALKVHSSTEQDVVRDTIDNAWFAFDSDNSGEISRGEFLCEGGLHGYLLLLEQEWRERPDDRNTYNFLNLNVKGGRRHNYNFPSLAADPEKWFDHIDYDHSKELSQKELTDGLIVSINANSSTKRRAIRDFVIAFWDKYDSNGDNVISKKEFLAVGGLAEMLIEFEQSNKSSEDEIASTLQIRVCIPRGMKAGDLMQVSSPKTQEIVVIQIPDKIVWNGGGEDPYYIVVSF